jgi:predicted DNA-binding antitoxin AbrB/MazE fold protein
MKTAIAAIYENGVFRPLQPLPDLRDRDQVHIIIEKQHSPLADCIGVLPDDAAAEMRLVIEREFEKVDADEWK